MTETKLKHILPQELSYCEETVTAKKIGELFFWTEQTECPECGNDVGNVVVLRSVDHEHHVCVKCCVQYEVHALAPFQWDAKI